MCNFFKCLAYCDLVKCPLNWRGKRAISWLMLGAFIRVEFAWYLEVLFGNKKREIHYFFYQHTYHNIYMVRNIWNIKNINENMKNVCKGLSKKNSLLCFVSTYRLYNFYGYEHYFNSLVFVLLKCSGYLLHFQRMACFIQKRSGFVWTNNGQKSLYIRSFFFLHFTMIIRFPLSDCYLIKDHKKSDQAILCVFFIAKNIME